MISFGPHAYPSLHPVIAKAFEKPLIKIVLSFICTKKWGINGLALATSISAIFNSIILYILLRKKIGDFGLKSFVSVGIKSLVSSGVMAVSIVWGSKHVSGFVTSEMLQLMISVGLGAIIYFIMGLILRTEPVMSVVNKLLKRK